MSALTLTSDPWGFVSIDGRPTGRRTPLVEYEVSPGKHQICVTADDGEVLCGDHTLNAGENFITDFAF